MSNIALPNKIEFKDGDAKNSGLVIVEPLYPGYGMTLGNSLRRVLLSSLPGAAVVGVKIKGIDHEFMPLADVKQDVLEIILNLKQLRLKVHSDEEVRLELSAKGKKVVTAGDIKKNSQVEIANPELEIAEITAKDGQIEMEIFVRNDMGYVLADNTKKDKEIGYIEVDSVFSPVLYVSIKVEDARVGKMTDWNRLILNIKTDGTVTYQEVFTESVKILVEQFSSLLGEKEKEEPVVVEEVVEVEPKKEKKEKKK
jgi:DNA-directed RNA polymerase subunit alpha